MPEHSSKFSLKIYRDAQREAAPKCANCGHPIQRARDAWRPGTGSAPQDDVWTHGIGRQSGYWQGRRCPGRFSGATLLPPEPIASANPQKCSDE